MIKDLNDIYDKGVGPGDPTDPPVDLRPARKLQGPGLGGPAVQSNYDPSEYTGYLEHPLFENQGDPNEQRGQAQSAWDKWGNALVQGVAKIGTDLAENVGYLGSAAAQWGDDRTYSNALTDAAKQADSWLDEHFPIYRKNNDTVGLTDAGWWAQQAEGLISMGGSFALTGSGLGKIFGLLGEGAEALNLGKTGIKAANTAARYLSSGALSYIMGAQGGAEVFKKTYDTQLKNNIQAGMDPTEADAKAKHVASQSAASTVQLTTMLNTGLNLEMLSGVFGHGTEDKIAKFWKDTGAQKEGETFDQFANRIKTGTSIEDKAVQDKVFAGSGWQHYLKSGLSGGLDMLNIQFAQRTGEALGQEYNAKTKSGTTKDMFDQLSELSHYFDRTMDTEGGLQFAIGALVGPLQSGIIDNLIPLHQVEKLDPTTGNPIQVKDGENTKSDGKGNTIYEQQRVTARNKGKYYDRQYFKNVRNAVMEDIGHIEDTKNKIALARKAGFHDRADALQEDLMNTMNFNAVHMGMGTNYSQTYRDIADTDNTISTRDRDIKPQLDALAGQLKDMPDGPDKEALLKKQSDLLDLYKKTPDETDAMQKGYAKDTNDNEYKKKAEDVIQTLKELEDIHRKVQSKYGGSDHPAIQQVADIISNRKMALHVQGKRIQKLQGEINQADLERDQSLDNAGDVDTHDKAVVKYVQDKQVAMEHRQRLVDQGNMLIEAHKTLAKDPGDPAALATVNNIIKKYAALGRSSADDVSASKDILGRIQQRIDNTDGKLKDIEDNLFQTTGYNDWLAKHPNGKFEDFQQAVAKKHGISKDMLARKAFLNDQIAEHQEGTRNLMELESDRGLKTMAKKSVDLYKELQKTEQEKRAKDLIEVAKRAKALVMSEKNLLRGKQRLQNEYYGELQMLQSHHARTVDALKTVNDKMEAISGGKSIMYFTSQAGVDEWTTLTGHKRDIEFSLQKTENRIAKIHSLYDDVTKDIKESEDFLARQLPVTKEAIVPNNDTSKADATTNPAKDEVTLPDPQPEQEPVAQQSASDKYAKALEEAADDYGLNSGLLSSKALTYLDAYVDSLKNSGGPVNMDFLKGEVQSEEIDSNEAAKIMLSVKHYMDAYHNLNSAIKNEEAQADSFAESIVNNMPSQTPDEIEDQPEENPMLGQPQSVPLDSTKNESSLNDAAFHNGAKAVNVVKINTLNLDYVEYWDPSTGSYKKFSEIHKINEKTNPDILNPRRLRAGTEVHLAIDTDYAGTSNHDFNLENDEYGNRGQKNDPVGKYMTDDHRVKEGGHENVPIKIVDANGKTLGYLPRMDWLNAKYPGTEGSEEYRNIVKEITLPDGTVVDNLTEQNKQLQAVRKAVAEAHNEGKGKLTTTILEKGPGMVILNREVNKNTEKYKDFTNEGGERKSGKIEWDKASTLLPDVTLLSAVINNDTVFVGNADPFQGKIVGNVNKYNNMPVMLLPAPNGEYHIAPLLSKPLYDPKGQQSEFNTLVRALEIFIGSHSEDSGASDAHKAEAAKILKGTSSDSGAGFDITTEQGLRDFINQYHTHTRDFTDDILTRAAKNGKMEFVFNIADSIGNQARGDISAGTTYSGHPAVKASLVDGKLNPEFVQALKDGLGKRFKNVAYTKGNLRGINGPGEFKGAKYRVNGTWEFKEYPSYNEYLKDNTTTNVVGTNKVDGRYVYAVHPQITMDVNKIISKPKVKIIDTSLPDPESVKTPVTAAEVMDSIFDDISNNSLSQPVVQIQNSLKLKEGTPVSYEALEKMLNFTADGNRNGKTVDQVLEDMQRLGISHLVDGYNPFSKCV